jgi:hypothetical protein
LWYSRSGKHTGCGWPRLKITTRVLPGRRHDVKERVWSVMQCSLCEIQRLLRYNLVRLRFCGLLIISFISHLSSENRFVLKFTCDLQGLVAPSKFAIVVVCIDVTNPISSSVHENFQTTRCKQLSIVHEN